MRDKEIISLLLRVINKKEDKIIELLKQLPFEDLLEEEQVKVMMADISD